MFAGVNRMNNRLMKAVFGERRISVLVFPWAVSWILTAFVLWSVLKTQPAFGTRMAVIAAAVSLAWSLLLALDCRRILRGKTRRTLRCSLPTALVLSLFLGYFFACIAWGSNYQSLAPLERLDNGTQHLDTLYLSSLAESFRSSVIPATLLNGTTRIPYHTFSNLLMSVVSRIAGVPAFIGYNYLYQTIFLPVYILAQLMAVAAAKEFFSNRTDLRLRDLAVILLVNVGFIYTPWLDVHGIWKRNYIISESFLIANTMAFLCYGVLFRVMKDPGKGKKRTNLVLFLLIPAGIFLITWCKISVGLLFAVSVMYYLFRTHLRELRFWGINILYGVILLAALWLFSLSGSAFLPSGGGFQLMAFQERCPGPLGIWGHYLILMILPAVFIGLEFFRLRKEKRVIATGKTVWIEDLLLFACAAFLPGFLMDIDGGSAVYFSCVLEIPAVLLLCGHPAFNREIRTDGWGKRIACFLCAAWCAVMCWFNRMEADPVKYVTGQHTSALSETLLEVREKYGQHPEEYAIFLEQDNIGTRIFKEARRSEMRTMYIWPAMTGIGVINGTYRENGTVYTYLGTEMTNYGSEYTDFDHALTWEEAKEWAREKGKKGVIRVTADGYEAELVR